MKFYIAGPMSGIPQFNFPAFFELGAKVRELGHEVINPAEIDTEEDQGAALASPDGSLKTVTKTWGDFLMRDVKIVADQVDGIVVLPNWEDSRGARLEVFVALNCDKPVFSLDDGALVELDPYMTARVIAGRATKQSAKEKARYDQGN